MKINQINTIVGIEMPEKECLYEVLKAKMYSNKNLKEFAQNNDALLQEFAIKMEQRKCSYRDLNAIFDNSSENYMIDKLNKKTDNFKSEYLEEALKSIELTDGEIYTVNNKKG